MKDLRTRFVAVEYNPDNTCKKVLSCVNLTESEYQKLLNESLVSKQHGLARLEKQKEDFEKIDTRLYEHDILLAKSIFDNFVDRGLIEEDDDLQRSFFNFIFTGSAFNPTNPYFLDILNKIRGN